MKCVLSACFQGNNERQYARDNFWLQTLSFKQRVDAGSFSSLYEVRDLVYSIHNLALMNDMKKKVKEILMRTLFLVKLGNFSSRIFVTLLTIVSLYSASIAISNVSIRPLYATPTSVSIYSCG